LYIYSKDNGFFDRYTKENESRELKKMKDELLKKDTELKILQRRYNKLLNNCIQIELNKFKRKYHFTLFIIFIFVSNEIYPQNDDDDVILLIIIINQNEI
jgi:hypothetical protein